MSCLTPAVAVPRVSAGILAGGAGLRHGGADKGWLPFCGRALIEHALDALRPQARELLVSANRNGLRYAQLGVRVVPDIGGAGPLAGLARLLAAARHDWLLCVPCDAPLLPTDLAARLQAAAESETADAALLNDGTQDHPTFCLVRTALAYDAAATLARGDYRLRDWFARHRVARLQAAAPVNLNTPEELQALEYSLRPTALESAA